MNEKVQSQHDRERLLCRLDELGQRVRQLESELERTHRLATLGTIAGSIAHEFNNILTPVMSYAQLALQARDDHQLVERALTKAVEGTDRAAQIASAMLGFIRNVPGECVADVASVARDTIACMGRDPAKDGIDVIVDVPSGCLAAIRPLALHQVLLNLLINARKAVRCGSGRIEIAASRSTWNTPGALPGDRVTITVSDNGCGIKAALLPHIFEAFVTDPSAQQGEEGTGLGLSICHRLVTQAGGEITVESQVGTGTRFTIVLPTAQAALERDAA